MSTNTAFIVKRYLFETGLSQTWLVNELAKCGLKITPSYLSKIVNERITNEQSRLVLNKSVSILADYSTTHKVKYIL